MAKNITSHDPRKKHIVAEFKRRFDCVKITKVAETKDHYQANCLRRSGREFESIGIQKIAKSELNLETTS